MVDVIYTISPLDLVVNDQSKEAERKFEQISYNGVEMQVEPVGTNQYQIIRLYSTDPAHFLEPELQPGQIISGEHQ